VDGIKTEEWRERSMNYEKYGFARMKDEMELEGL